MIGLFILGCVLVFAFMGYCQGLMRQLIGIAALVLAFFFAGPAGALLPKAWLAAAPAVLHPTLRMGLGGLIVMVGALVVGRLGAMLLRARKGREQARAERKRDHRRGAGFGAVKGLLVAVLMLVIGYNLGEVAQVISQRAGIDKNAAPNTDPRRTMAAKVANALSSLKASIDDSVAGPLVKATSPIEPEVFDVIGDVIDMSHDAKAMQRLHKAPELQPLLNNPKVVALTKNRDIMKAVKEHRFRDLLDNPDVASALQDPDLRAELKKLDIKAIIESAKGP